VRGKVTSTSSSVVQLKRAYESPEVSDGVRVLVDRLWPRGVSRDTANLDAWMKELGPSDQLRRWFGHQPALWDAFVRKYRLELATPLRRFLLVQLQGIAAESTLTLVYGARDAQENEAVVLRQTLLGESIDPDGTWDAATQLLVTASVVAAAHRDATVPVSSLKLFASSILTGSRLDDALDGLLRSGKLRVLPRSWQLTTSGYREVRQLASANSANGAV
jgi:uncharacterized protein YeaO (DUF488 family)